MAIKKQNKNQKKWFPYSIILLFTPFLTACFGDGSESIKPMPTGAYIGKTGNDFYFNVLILPNGDYWGIVGQPLATGGLRTIGSMTGHGDWKLDDQEVFSTEDAKGILFSPANRELPIQSTQPIKMSTRFGDNGRFSGQASTLGFGEMVFGGVRVEDSRYNILTPPNISEYIGLWNGYTINQMPTQLEILPDGQFAGSIGDCQYSGHLKSHADGLNLKEAELNVGPSPCINANAKFKGLAVIIPLEGGAKKQLMISGFNFDRSKGISFSAVR